LVVDFFATWCLPCRDAIPHLRRLRAAGVTVIAIDIGEDAAAVQDYARKLGIDWPIFLDPELKFADGAGVARIPAILVVDVRGNIVHRSIHADAELEASAKRYLGAAGTLDDGPRSGSPSF